VVKNSPITRVKNFKAKSQFLAYVDSSEKGRGKKEKKKLPSRLYPGLCWGSCQKQRLMGAISKGTEGGGKGGQGIEIRDVIGDTASPYVIGQGSTTRTIIAEG